MRYIQKTKTPDFFLKETSNLENWKKFREGKRKLKRYILDREQKYICAYCETRVEVHNSHIEHIKPQSKYNNEGETFNYDNLVVSCNGKEYCKLCSLGEEENTLSCGHKKGDNFDEHLFIAPTKETNCANFFKYDKTSGKIFPNKNNPPLDIQKAAYTISILSLDNVRLNQARLNAKRAVEKMLWKMRKQGRKKKSRELMRDRLRILLNPHKKKVAPFLSFLQFYFYH